MAEIITTILAALTVIGDLFLISMIFLFFAKSPANKFLKKHADTFSFIIASIATLGSLYFSQALGLAPCELCWYQRIFMYPLALLLFISLFKKQDISDYVIPMSLIGAVIAGYHYSIQIFGIRAACSGVESCAALQIVQFGYVTIPMMALTAFLMIFVLQLMKRVK